MGKIFERYELSLLTSLKLVGFFIKQYISIYIYILRLAKLVFQLAKLYADPINFGLFKIKLLIFFFVLLKYIKQIFFFLKSSLFVDKFVQLIRFPFHINRLSNRVALLFGSILDLLTHVILIEETPNDTMFFTIKDVHLAPCPQ